MLGKKTYSRTRGDFWAITSYFNPTNSIRRIQNFRRFREALNVPLVAVEWSWSQGPRLQLDADDAEILVQVCGPDLIWQKERLLNLAISKLPENCRYVAWLDCDVLFEDHNWYLSVARKLEQVLLVQPYSCLINLDAQHRPIPDGEPGGGIRSPISDRKRWASLPEDFLKHQFTGLPIACGYAWAARVELLRKHGLYDACVMGGGDRAIFYAAIGRIEEAAEYLKMSEVRLRHYKEWAIPFWGDIRGSTGWVPGAMRNLWHGAIQKRRYEDRHKGFIKFEFDPYSDVMIGADGEWRWASAKEEMRQYVVDYFFSRGENLEP